MGLLRFVERDRWGLEAVFCAEAHGSRPRGEGPVRLEELAKLGNDSGNG